MSGVKGRSGRRVASKKTLDKLLSHADTVVLRTMYDESIPLIERGRLAVGLTLKKIAERSESVVLNLNLSDELIERMLSVMQLSRTAIPPPPAGVIVEVEATEPDTQSAPDSTPDTQKKLKE